MGELVRGGAVFCFPPDEEEGAVPDGFAPGAAGRPGADAACLACPLITAPEAERWREGFFPPLSPLTARHGEAQQARARKTMMPRHAARAARLGGCFAASGTSENGLLFAIKNLRAKTRKLTTQDN